mmetsp:Transcript_14363/g.29565  ORF Transcript_14363/g.29565 Transcript_14363/m.29565 type:complete len:1255 (-) Transcript_14363:67-3831(-)
MVADNGRRKSLRNLMGLEPDLPAIVSDDQPTSIAQNAQAIAEGLRGLNSSSNLDDESSDDGAMSSNRVSSPPDSSSSPAPAQRMWGFSTKPSGRLRRESFRTQVKEEEEAASAMFGVDRNSSRELHKKVNKFGRRPSTSTASDQVAGMLPAEYAEAYSLSNITEGALDTGRSSANDSALESTVGPLPGDSHPDKDDSNKTGLRPPGSPANRQQRRSSIMDVATNATRKLRNITKLKTAAKVIGLMARLKNANKVEAVDGVASLEEAKQGSMKLFRKSKRSESGNKEPASTNEMGRIRTQSTSAKTEQNKRKRIDAKKHENLVDQLKLRKKTAVATDIRASMSKLSKKHSEQFDNTKVCGLKVWHPRQIWIRNWDILVAVLVLSQVIIVPLQIAGFPGWEGDKGEGEGETLTAGEKRENYLVGVDVIFLLDIFVQFNLAIEKGEQGYYGDDIELVTDRKEIAKAYCRKWFIVDLLAISPLFIYIVDKVEKLSGDSETRNLLKLVKAARLPRLFRLMRILRVMRTLNMKSKKMQWFMYSRYSYLFNVLNLIVALFIFAHFFACFWYMISKDNIAQRFHLEVGTLNPEDKSGYCDDEVEECYHVYDLHYTENITKFRAATYVQTFHQAVLMIMGESFENEVDSERWISSLMMIFGAICMAFIFGEVSMCITNFYASTNMFQKKMTDLYESMEALHLPQNLQERIHLFYKYVWDEHHSIDGRPAILTFVPELSTNLAKEIYLYLFSDMITKVPMFHNRPADVVQHLVLAVQTLIYMPKDYVIVKGEFGQEMFFIQSGKCDVIIEISKKVDDEEDSPAQKGRIKGWGKKIGKKIKERTHREKKGGGVASGISRMLSMNPNGSGRESIGGNRESGRMSVNGSVYKVVEKAVKELDAGSYFGEIALITDSRRTASIRSRTFTELLVLCRDDFNRITENNQEDREEMKDQIKKRYNDKNVKKALEKKDILTEEEKRKRDDALEQRKSQKRTSFLGLTMAQGDNKGTLGASELFEIRSQLRGLRAAVIDTNKAIHAMNKKDKKRRDREKGRRSKIRKWKLEKKKNRMDMNLEYVGRSISTYVDTEESSSDGESELDYELNVSMLSEKAMSPRPTPSASPKLPERGSQVIISPSIAKTLPSSEEIRVQDEARKRIHELNMLKEREERRESERRKEIQMFKNKKKEKSQRKSLGIRDEEDDSSVSDSDEEINNVKDLPKFDTPSHKRIQDVLNNSKLGISGARISGSGGSPAKSPPDGGGRKLPN